MCLLTAWALVVIVPDMTRLWAPLGTLGLQIDNDGVVTDIDEHGPAARAGVAIDDHVDLAKTPFDSRRAVGGLVFVKPDQPLQLVLDTARGTKAVAVRPEPETLTAADKVTLFLDEIFGVAFVLLGATLVLLRPGAMTWGFFLYSIWFNPGQFFALYAWLPARWLLVQEILQAVFTSAGYVGFLLFALRFPHDAAGGWRRWAQWLLAPLFVFLAVLAVDAFGFAVGRHSEAVARYSYTADTLVYLVVAAALLTTMLEHSAQARQRIKWVVFGCIIGLPAFIFADSNEATSWWVPFWTYLNGHWPQIPSNPPQWLLHLLYLVNIAVPLTVAYAVVKHRVIDVRFAINRSIVLAVSGMIVAVALEGIHFVLDETLKDAGIEAAGVALGAVAAGLGFHWLREQVGHVVDVVFFRRWHDADHHLAAVCTSVHDASSAEDIDACVIAEPVHSLSLAYGAVFHRRGDGSFVRTYGLGWDERALPSLSNDHPLVERLSAARGAAGVADLAWESGSVPAAGPPALAVPIIIGQRLAAIALYGPHRGGEDINPDEAHRLRKLAHNAAAAYSAVEADALRREVKDLRLRLGLA